MLSKLTVILTLGVLAPPLAAAEDERHYNVGVAKVDVTPDYPIRLNGFNSRKTESEGVTQPIFAKALAIDAPGGSPLVLITTDNLGMRLPLVDAVARRLQAQAGVDPARVAVTFTHTHTAPMLAGACETIFSEPIPPEHQAHIDRYTKEFSDALVEVALAALNDRRPAQLSWAVGNVGFAMNRRTPGGPVDHALPMLVVASPADGAIRAIYATYACHCVTLSNNKISGDWAGYAQAAIERRHPGTVALVSIGCGSDANPNSGVTGDNTAVAAQQGDEIAAEVDRLLKTNLAPITGPLAATRAVIDLPLNPPPTREQLEAAAQQPTSEGYNAKFQLAKLDRGEALQTSIAYPIQTWTFGDSLAMVFLAGEICVDYSLRLKNELDAARCWFTGYSNEFCSYIPSERLLREGGYGGGAEIMYFGLPATLAPGLEKKIIDEVHRQLPQPFHKPVADPAKKAEPKPAAAAKKQNASLAQLKTHDDLVVELVAAEPLISSPVAIDFGPDGRLWVAEMRDYSQFVDAQFEQTGRLVALDDSNGDGRFDASTVFATGLRFPTDVKLWGAGVIVCDAPDVIYLEDTDRDGTADLRKTLLTGFATHNAQARVNSLRLGLDNWLYGSCGIFGGDIKTSRGRELPLGGRDFRFLPGAGAIEPVAGNTQQGRTRDDWGNWFGCENGTILKHYPLVDHYVARNPHIAPPAGEVFVPQGGDPNQLFPVGQPTLYKLSGPPGRPTSICGADIYRDDLLGPDYAGNAFVADPANNLVHRLVLAPQGVTFAGRRPDDEADREFLASPEHQFRPVQIRTGLDGCLWVVDMHRAVIEHKKFIPEETLRDIDLWGGRDEGRIYRIRPRDASPRKPPRLDRLDAEGLVAALDSPNGTQRDLAQELLVRQASPAAAPRLEALLASSQRPAARVQALATLDGLHALRAETVIHALGDSHPGVRRHALRLSERFLNERDATDLSTALLRLADDPDSQVQLQLAYTLGQWHDDKASDALARLAWANHADPYVLSAVWSSVNARNVDRVLDGLLAPADKRPLPDAFFQPLATLAIKRGDSACARKVLAALSRTADGRLAAWRLAALAELLEVGAAAKKNPLSDEAATDAQLQQLAAQAQAIGGDADAPAELRLRALRILAAASSDRDLVFHVAAELLGPQSAPAVQQAVVDILVGVDPQRAAQVLIHHWSSYTHAARTHAVARILERQEMIPKLLRQIQRGAIRAEALDAAARQQLLSHADAEIRDLAATAFAGAIDADREAVLQRYAPAASLAGDVPHGRQLFQKLCATCHRLENQGFEVGPDLAALTTRTQAALLESVLDPNRTIEERYQSYAAYGLDGRTTTGVLVDETATSITLRQQEGKETTLLRRDLDELRDTGLSLMPVGFEKDLAPQDLADVLAYVAAQQVRSGN